MGSWNLRLKLVLINCSIGDVGDGYIPTNEETLQPWDFQLIGFYKRLHAQDAQAKLNGTKFAGVALEVTALQPWFVELYPKKKKFNGSGSL